MKKKGLFIVHFSIHGLVRGRNLELGVDADTGGQVKYVVELCKELGRHPDVSLVYLITRLVRDPNVSQDYTERIELLGENVYLVRFQFGPEKYLMKEELWPHLGELEVQCSKLFASLGKTPDLLHAHYADAGCVASNLATMLGIPWVFTGHSLGLVKLHKLLQIGKSKSDIDQRYRILHRIQAEEDALASACMVISSTKQEDACQYSQYKNYKTSKLRIIPPGINYDAIRKREVKVESLVGRFLKDEKKPMVLAVARADIKKNLAGLVEGFAMNEWLRKNANLVILSGKRGKVDALPAGARGVWESIFKKVDDGNLYGVCAYPKSHNPEDVGAVMAAAKESGGVLVNPALIEPFGLSLIEAAAVGLPIVATNNGGPSEIISNCRHGVLVDPLDLGTLGTTVESLIKDRKKWESLSSCGLLRVKTFYSWESHVSKYMESINEILQCRTIENIALRLSGFKSRNLFKSFQEDAKGVPYKFIKSSKKTGSY